jgi:chitinase
MRKRTLLVGASAAAALLAGAGVTVALNVTNASAATGYSVAPYVDLTAASAGQLNSAITSGGLSAFTAAFVIGQGCTPIWGDTLGVDNSTVNPFIASAEAKGAKMIVSFGGAGGVELAQSCTNTSSLTAAYQSVISHYKVDHVDFDVEGAAIADQASIDRRFAAIKALIAANSGLQVSVTIPVLPSGPDGNGASFLRSAKSDGVSLSIVNAMTMDYGAPNSDMATAAETAATGTLNAAKSAGFSNFTFANIGVTPMIGNNDSPGEVVSEANARTIVNWAHTNGVGRLAFWSIGRDQPCAGGGVSPNCSGLGGAALDFTKIFTGGSTGGGGTTPTTPAGQPTTSAPTSAPTTTAPTGTGTHAAWVPNHPYKIGDVVSYQGKNYKCIQAHTSLTGWEPPVVPALWQPI